MRKPLLILCSSLALSACATLLPQRAQPGTELIGRSLQVVTDRGQQSILRFNQDGTVRATFAGGQTSGRWFVRDRRLCFLWGSAPQECWPYASQFQPGRTRAITSDRGNRVQVTLR